MESTPSSNTQIGQEAGEWLADLEEPHPDDRYPGPTERRKAFIEWLARSPEHARVFSEMVKIRRRLRGIDPLRRVDVDALMSHISAEVIPLRHVMEQPQSPTEINDTETPSGRLSSRKLFVGVAAVAVLAIVGMISVSTLDSQTYTTAVGEQHTCKLEDGSVIVLNTNSQLIVDFGRKVRVVRLLRGEALFTVERDPHRPFVVSAGDATIQVMGTVFDVRQRAESTDVSVIEGAVQVAPDRGSITPVSAAVPVKIVAGEQIQMQSGRVSKRANPQIDDALAWRTRRLVFRGTSLAEVAAELNRYNRAQIRVEGAAVQKKEVTGIFDVDRPQSIALFASEDRSLTVERDGNDWVIRAR